MNDYIQFKGVSSAEVGIVATELPERVIAEERVSFTDVPGRSGSLTQTEGTDVFNDIVLPVKFYCPNPTEAVYRQIEKYFRGRGQLRIPTRPGGYYDGCVVNQIPMAKILRGNAQRTFSVNFRCKPLFHLDAGEEEVTVTSGDFLENPTDICAKPVIEISGSGDITLMVGTTIISLTDIDEGIILDSELQEAYWDGVLMNSHMSGLFPELGVGNTAISWTGGTVTSVKVTPCWVER